MPGTRHVWDESSEASTETVKTIDVYCESSYVEIERCLQGMMWVSKPDSHKRL